MLNSLGAWVLSPNKVFEKKTLISFKDSPFPSPQCFNMFSFPMLFSANTKIVMHPEQSYGAFKEADALLSCAIFGSDLELV